MKKCGDDDDMLRELAGWRRHCKHLKRAQLSFILAIRIKRAVNDFIILSITISVHTTIDFPIKHNLITN